MNAHRVEELIQARRERQQRIADTDEEDDPDSARGSLASHRLSCTACSAPNDDDAVFCSKCGASMAGGV